VVSRRDFLPFGEDIFVNIGARTSALQYNSTTDDIRQQFTGYQKDEESGLDFAEARMYENRLGRFTAVDPLLASGKSANPQTFNRYVYVLNNPLLFIDQNGLFPIYFYFRSFAPFEKFGGIFHGDGKERRFSTSVDEDTTSRMQLYVEAETNVKSVSFTTTRNETFTTMEISRRAQAIGSMSVADYYLFTDEEFSEAYLKENTGDLFGTTSTPTRTDLNSTTLGYQLYGNNDAFPVGGYGPIIRDYNLSNDIDLFVNVPFSVRSTRNGYQINIEGGTVTGDQFPAAEAFMRDSKGNGVFLGTFSIPEGNSPFNSLPGNNRRPMMTIENFSVNTNRDGIFQSVRYSGRTYSLDQWNRRFTQRTPVQQ